MKILVIGRTLPLKSSDITGIFEFEQAKGASQIGYNVIYGFVDNRSIKVMRSINKVDKEVRDIKTIGYYLPIGGITKKIYDFIKYKLFKKMFNNAIKHYGKLDIVHIHFPLININSKIIRFLKQQDVEIVITEHWSKVLNKALSNREEGILELLFKESSKVIAVSSNLEKALSEYNKKFEYPFKDNIFVIPNLVDSVFSYIPLEKSENFTYATVGRLVNMKGNDIVIKALAEVVKKRPNVKLYIIGDGPERKSLENLIKDYYLVNKVIITGYLSADEIKEFYKEINVYVTGSKIETFGVPVIESWLIGRPVIIGDNHPMSSEVNKANGLIYEYYKDNTYKNLAEKMLEVQDMKYEYEKIALDCYRNFSRQNVLARLDEIYRSLSSGN